MGGEQYPLNMNVDEIAVGALPSWGLGADWPAGAEGAQGPSEGALGAEAAALHASYAPPDYASSAPVVVNEGTKTIYVARAVEYGAVEHGSVEEAAHTIFRRSQPIAVWYGMVWYGYDQGLRVKGQGLRVKGK